MLRRSTTSLHDPKATEKPKYNYASDLKLDPTKQHRYIKDMYYKLDGKKFGEMSFGDFMMLLITELLADRANGYVRLFLYPREQFFDPEKIIAIFISKRNVYIVAVQDADGRVYEVGTKEDGFWYFIGSVPTGFGQHYAALFGNRNLSPIEIGYEVLDRAIRNIINNGDTLRWAWSVGIFALMFCECSRFVWFSDKLIDVMERKGSIKMWWGQCYKLTC